MDPSFAPHGRKGPVGPLEDPDSLPPVAPSHVPIHMLRAGVSCCLRSPPSPHIQPVYRKAKRGRRHGRLRDSLQGPARPPRARSGMLIDPASDCVCFRPSNIGIRHPDDSATCNLQPAWRTNELISQLSPMIVALRLSVHQSVLPEHLGPVTTVLGRQSSRPNLCNEQSRPYTFPHDYMIS